MISVKNISKTYIMGEIEVHALKDVSLEISRGDFVAIMGPSGSGKSTLSNILGLLDIPSSGSYELNDKDISSYTEDELSILRRDEIGFIFQQFNLLPRMTGTENVELPLLYSKNIVESERTHHLLELVNLVSRAHHRPNELSGGQQQRIAIARALMNNPRIIFADEPTGNLDSQSEKEILATLKALNEEGITIIMVTHEEDIGRQAKRLIKMRDGEIISDERLVELTPAKNLSTPYTKKKTSLLIDIFDYFKLGYKTLLANKIRSTLSMLGILIGVAAVVAILAIGKGASHALEEQLTTLGSNLLVLKPGNLRHGGVSYQGGALKLYEEDGTFLKHTIPNIKAISPNVDGRAQLEYTNKNWNSAVTGVQANYPDLRNWNPTLGRFFTNAEDKSRARVCLIGTTILKELFNNENPVGEIIKINRISFQIIGVMEEKSGGGWRDQNDMVLVPLETAMKRLLGKDSVDSIDIMIKDMNKSDDTEKEISSRLFERKNIPLSQQENAIRIMNMAEIQQMITQSNQTMSLLLAAVAGISLLVGGIGIMNIMLVSVTERTKEIGLRKAIGAKRRDIMLQFLSESIVLSACGGLLGIFLGWLASSILSSIVGWETSISIPSVLLAFIFSSFIGIVFGIYPARRASILHPIDALRYE